MYSLLVISCRAHKHFAIHIRMETSELMKSNARQADPVLSRAQQARRVPPSKRTYMKSKSAVITRRRQLRRVKAPPALTVLGSHIQWARLLPLSSFAKLGKKALAPAPVITTHKPTTEA